VCARVSGEGERCDEKEIKFNVKFCGNNMLQPHLIISSINRMFNPDIKIIRTISYNFYGQSKEQWQNFRFKDLNFLLSFSMALVKS
jgi:hypothetical protein